MGIKQRVAVLSLQRLGDVLTANRVTAGLQRDPAVAEVELIHWDATESSAALLPGVTARHPLPYAELRERVATSPLAAFAALRERMRALQERGYDRVINLSSTRFACLLAPLLTTGLVWGPTLDDCGTYCANHPAIDYLNAWGVDPGLNVFAHQDLYTLAAGIPLAPAAYLPADSLAERDLEQRVTRLSDRPIALHVRSSATEKDWRDVRSIAGWRGLGAELQRTFGVPIVVLGSPTHADELGALAAETGAQLCAWPLRETAALLRHCRGIVSVDTVTIHLAAQVGCPSIVLRQGSARGMAFVPGTNAVLVDDARDTASVDDLVHLARHHFMGDGLPPLVARSLMERLDIRQGVLDTHGYLGAAAPPWLPETSSSRNRSHVEAQWRTRWHHLWSGDPRAFHDIDTFMHDDPQPARARLAAAWRHGIREASGW